MKEFNIEQPKTAIEEIREGILRVPELIEAEYQRSMNPWYACVSTRTAALGFMVMAKRKELGEEKSASILEKIDAISQRVKTLKKNYPKRETDPSDEEKQEILHMFESILDDLKE